MANIKDVARHAGLSPSCVSKYLKDKNSVRADSRIKIEKAINELNYVPSNIARSLRNGNTRTIMAIMPTITLPFFAEIFEFLRTYIASSGYNLSLYTLNGDTKFSHRDFLFSDGAIVAFPNNSEVVREIDAVLTKTNKPLVVMHGEANSKNTNSVFVDIREGMEQAALYLKDNGRKRIAYVGGDKRSVPSIERFSGFTNVIPEELRLGIYRKDFSMNWGYESARKMIDSNQVPDSVLCENDGIAAGVINYLMTHGISVPHDVWVIGFDNIPLSEMFTPSISSVSIPSQKMAEEAVRILFKAMKTKESEKVSFKASLIIRESSK